MIEHVLVPVDGSPLSWRALAFAQEAHPDADLTVIRVIDYVEESYGAEMLVGHEELRERATERAEDLFDEVRERTADHGGAVRTVTKFGKTASVITDFAADEDVDVVVIGGHGRSMLSRFLLGDVAQVVVKRASVPVTVVR